jgi:hypothetical protein
LYVDTDKYYAGEGAPILDAVHSQLKDLIRRRLDESGVEWSSFVFDASYDLITKADIEAIEAKVLASGYRFTWSAMISVRERPEAYVSAGGAEDESFSFEHAEATTAPPDERGRELRGFGDNVVKQAANTTGIARYVRSSDQVLRLLTDGIPPDTIAIIDDSGGTLTAPILEGFKGVICAGGTVRSHLGILTREYGIPCFMNAKISGIVDGDRVEMETTAKPKTTEAYQKGIEMTANVWRIAPAAGA